MDHKPVSHATRTESHRIPKPTGDALFRCGAAKRFTSHTRRGSCNSRWCAMRHDDGIAGSEILRIYGFSNACSTHQPGAMLGGMARTTRPTGIVRSVAAQHGFYARPSAHLPRLATRAGVGTILRSSGITRFVYGGVVKTFRCTTYPICVRLHTSFT